MDKIYSRKRLLIPKLKARNRRSGIRGWLWEYFKFIICIIKTYNTAIIVIIAVCIANRIISTIEPIMDVLCIDMAKSIATRVSNEQATNVMRQV